MPLPVYVRVVASQGATDLEPLLAFLRQRMWPQLVTTYDQYGGRRMSVMLEPAPSADQLRELTTEFGDAYEFTTVTEGRRPTW